jgi:hypothetical protein
MVGKVVAVSTSGKHSFSKRNRDRIRLLAGFGVERPPLAQLFVAQLQLVIVNFRGYSFRGLVGVHFIPAILTPSHQINYRLALS